MKLFYWLLLLFFSILLIEFDPLKIPIAFYAVPVLLGTYLMIKYTNSYAAKGVFDEPKYLDGLKSILAFLGLLLTAGIKIPLLSELIKLLTTVAGSWDAIGQSVNFIIGFTLTIYAIFAKKDSTLGKLSKSLSNEITPKEKYYE